MQNLISFFNTTYPCDHFFETHITDIRYTPNYECQCIIKQDLSHDIVFTIKDVTVEGNCAMIELKEFDFEDYNFHDILKPYSKCSYYELFWIDENGKRHEYKVIGTNTIGNNNGMVLEEIK